MGARMVLSEPDCAPHAGDDGRGKRASTRRSVEQNALHLRWLGFELPVPGARPVEGVVEAGQERLLEVAVTAATFAPGTVHLGELHRRKHQAQQRVQGTVE